VVEVADEEGEIHVTWIELSCLGAGNPLLKFDRTWIFPHTQSSTKPLITFKVQKSGVSGHKCPEVHFQKSGGHLW
jgi:hypothetical protein